jgi:DNA-binding response OmpR family regulator
MANKPILIVDDEKNIRLTLMRSLEDLGVEIDIAGNGEEALYKLKERDFGAILLDLHMPGVDGMEVLRQARKVRPDIKIIIITAYGTVERAVEAMKLGAVEFLQKPFLPEEIRGMVARVIDREKLDEQKVADYMSSIELAKKSILDRHVDAAAEHVRKAISLDPARAEAFNLLGAIMEIRGDRNDAQKNYRTALSLDPSYKPAANNLQRSTQGRWKRKGPIDLDENILEPHLQTTSSTNS